MKRQKTIKVALSDAEYARLEVAAYKASVSATEFLRDFIKTLPHVKSGTIELEKTHHSLFD